MGKTGDTLSCIGIRVLICGKKSYLFQEGNEWFVEAKENRS